MGVLITGELHFCYLRTYTVNLFSVWMVCCADTLLPLTIINRGGLRGRPTIYPPETLDSFIKLYRQGKPIKCIADALRMPLSTSYRIAQRLG